MMKFSPPSAEDWLIHLEAHFARRSRMSPQDIYKLLYQGLLGPEHLVDSPEAFADRLHAELQSLSPGIEDPLYEAIRPDQALMRVNLRPFKANQLDLESLLAVCLETADRTWGDPADLKRLWVVFAGNCHQRTYATFSPAELDEFTTFLEAHDYPAVHHSQRYRAAYAPAYRLVAADLTALL